MLCDWKPCCVVCVFRITLPVHAMAHVGRIRLHVRVYCTVCWWSKHYIDWSWNDNWQITHVHYASSQKVM